MSCRVLTVMIPLLAGLSAQSGQKPTVQVSGIPDRLVLPLPSGENRVVRAHVRGGKPDSVWLATSKGSSNRLPLDQHPDGGFQVNLADRRVMALAQADRNRQFRVFARVARRTIGSLPIAFHISEKPTGVTLWIREGAAKRQLPSLRRSWVRPSGTTRFELAIEGNAIGVEAELRIGKTAHEFQPADPRGVLTLTLTPAMRREWERATRTEVAYSSHAVFGGRFRLQTIPKHLANAANGGAGRFRVAQREESPVPGTNGWLLVACDDVTGGQVRVTLRNADRDAIVADRSMKQGDQIDVTLHGARYSLVLAKLVNVLIGSGDHGEFRLEPFDAKRTERRAQKRLIRDLLSRIVASRVEFVRDGKAYAGYQAKQHLLAKLGAHPVETADSFVADLASRSSTTGKPYQIKLPTGELLPAKKWLKAQLADLRKRERGTK